MAVHHRAGSARELTLRRGSGRHRRRRRSPWVPVLGALTGVVLGGATYSAVVLSFPEDPPLPAGPAGGAAPGAPDRTARVTEVVDGDSFVIDDGTVVRVLAADSCEMRTDAGPAARADAARVLDGATVELRSEPTGTNGTDRDGRLLRYVEVPGIGDLGAYLVARPHTAVYQGFNDASAGYVDRLRALDGDGRRCAATLPDPDERPDVRYRDCTAATAAGVAPLYVGDPGYSRGLDVNDDGVACE